MVKRKRQNAPGGTNTTDASQSKKTKSTTNGAAKPSKLSMPETLQIIVGSYDQVLHGVTATFEPESTEAQFADTFLFNAHTSAIRCVAVSPISPKIPGQTQKVLLASGSTDERVHVYNLSAHPPQRRTDDLLAKVAPRPILENPKNKELGALLHHSSSITSLCFPTRSKLLSSSEDSTIAVTKIRDLSLMTTIKAPIPKAYGRPSGDTAPFGGTPSGVNDFAIHPSMKVMLSVSKGERCMRLWNLVTGKKAGVLSFTRNMLQEASEGKHSTGEGRKLKWGNVDGADEFAVGFERDIIVFSMDSVPKCRVMPGTGVRTKIHQFTYIDLDDASLLAVSTEDGRIVLFSTKADDLVTPEKKDDDEDKLPVAKMIGHIGGRDAGVSGRIKDFAVLRSIVDPTGLYVVGASSDGNLRVWTLDVPSLEKAAAANKESKESLGQQVGLYETKNRITCLAGFVMVPKPEGAEDSEEENLDADSDDDDEDDDESD
ncbi:hypothetical protein VHEMI05985 [[Torrubiella] hemipterigena]|uniref:Uncharacterized protein n=1 Tax=[Torrubiella] hemipterigena TaxID=1531966 RepID=A0A0A1TI30_9HYPO|nr:hypothetical protein VHEMI05985 [[Torrubiella] hemipterigena]